MIQEADCTNHQREYEGVNDIGSITIDACYSKPLTEIIWIALEPEQR